MKYYCDKCKKKEHAEIILNEKGHSLIFSCGNIRQMNSKEIRKLTIYLNELGIQKHQLLKYLLNELDSKSERYKELKGLLTICWKRKSPINCIRNLSKCDDIPPQLEKFFKLAVVGNQWLLEAEELIEELKNR